MSLPCVLDQHSGQFGVCGVGMPKGNGVNWKRLVSVWVLKGRPLCSGEDDMLSLSAEGWGCDVRYPFYLPLLSLGVGSARNQLSPRGLNMPSPLPPALSSSCFLADSLSGNHFIWGKSGLIYFTLGGSCYPGWVCVPSQHCF
jgi:hypothetical protein